MLKSKIEREREGEGEYNIRSSRRFAKCFFCLLLLPLWTQRSASHPLCPSPTLWWVSGETVIDSAEERQRQRESEQELRLKRESVGSFSAQLFDEFLIGSCWLFIRGRKGIWNFVDYMWNELEYIEDKV